MNEVKGSEPRRQTTKRFINAEMRTKQGASDILWHMSITKPPHRFEAKAAFLPPVLPYMFARLVLPSLLFPCRNTAAAFVRTHQKRSFSGSVQTEEQKALFLRNTYVERDRKSAFNHQDGVWNSHGLAKLTIFLCRRYPSRLLTSDMHAEQHHIHCREFFTFRLLRILARRAMICPMVRRKLK